MRTGIVIYHVLANLFRDDVRPNTVSALRISEKPAGCQDEILLASFVLVVGAFSSRGHPSTSRKQTSICSRIRRKWRA